MHFVLPRFTDFTFTAMCCNPLIPHWKWPWGDGSRCSPHCFPHLEVHLKWQKAAGCQDVWQPIMSLFFFLFCGRGDGVAFLGQCFVRFFSVFSNLLPACWSPFGEKSDSEWWESKVAVLLWPTALSAICRDQLVFAVWWQWAGKQSARRALQLLLAVSTTLIYVFENTCTHVNAEYLRHLISSQRGHIFLFFLDDTKS